MPSFSQLQLLLSATRVHKVTNKTMAKPNGDEQVTIVDLPSSVLSHIISFLDARSVLSACQVCSAWSAAGSETALWARLASEVWPADCMDAMAYNGSFKALYLDANRHNAIATVPLEGLSSKYRYRSDDSYYECKMLGMEVSMGEPLGPHALNTLRLFIDARGETDLRRMETSCLAVVKLGIEPVQVPCSKDVPGPMHLEDHMDEESRRQFKQVHEARTANSAWFEIRRRHQQRGSLAWEGSSLSPLMAALGSHDDSHLIFIYANHLRSGARDMDHAYTMSFPDYGYVVLLKGGHESIAQLGKPISENQYRNKSPRTGSIEHMLVNESADAARARWSDLPAGVQERGNNWWAPVAMGDDEQEAWLHAQDGLGAHALGLVGFGQEAWQDEEEEEAHMDD